MTTLQEAAMRQSFETWAKPILGDNPTWKESGECELAWQSWKAALAQQGEQPTYAELLDYVERLEASQKYLQGPAKSIVLGLVDDYAAAATNYYQGKETKELWEKMVAARKLVEDALK